MRASAIRRNLSPQQLPVRGRKNMQNEAEQENTYATSYWEISLDPLWIFDADNEKHNYWESADESKGIYISVVKASENIASSTDHLAQIHEVRRNSFENFDTENDSTVTSQDHAQGELIIYNSEAKHRIKSFTFCKHPIAVTISLHDYDSEDLDEFTEWTNKIISRLKILP